MDRGDFRMTPQDATIIASIIQGGATVLAALIAAGWISLSIRSKRDMDHLTQLHLESLRDIKEFKKLLEVDKK
jgi:hypothetical protein